LPALQAYNAGMPARKTVKTVQYTVRGVSPRVDRALRVMSRREGCSLNETLLRALRQFAGVSQVRETHHDLDDLAGTWIDDSELDAAFAEQRWIDVDLWQ